MGQFPQSSEEKPEIVLADFEKASVSGIAFVALPTSREIDDMKGGYGVVDTR